MPFRDRVYGISAVFLLLLLAASALPALASTTAVQDSIDVIRVPSRVDAVEGVPLQITAQALAADSIIDLSPIIFLGQTNNLPFLAGPDSTVASRPGISLEGTPDFSQSGTYTIFWTMVNRSATPFTTTLDTTTVVIHDLFPPTPIEAYYIPVPAGVPIANSTGVLNFVVWDGSGPTADPLGWNGWRVRRTIHGIDPNNFDVAGQYVNWIVTKEGNFHIPVASLCFDQFSPCDPDSFAFTGAGIFFRGFSGNSRGGGDYVIDYPPGAPVDSCSSCWVYADLTALAGFPVDYTVTSIGPFSSNDYVESPLSQSAVASILPSTAPADNLEHVAVVPNPYKGSAQWDPAVGEGRVHFIHLPVGATVRIFTSSGDFVRELKLDPNSHPGGETGELYWDLRNGKGNKIVSGIYIYQVETTQGRTRKGHFVIIK